MSEFFKKDQETLQTEAEAIFKPEASMIDAKILELHKELASLERKKHRIGELLNEQQGLGYAGTFVPASPTLLDYTGRGSDGQFDALTGLVPNDPAIYKHKISFETKKGDLCFVTGYVPELGSIVVRSVEYRWINNKMNICPLYEYLLPVIGDSSKRGRIRNLSTGEISMISSYASYYVPRSNATEFLNLFYGTNRDIEIEYRDLVSCLAKNKSFEIIWKTVDDEETFRRLLNEEISEPMPIHRYLGVTKEEYQFLKDENLIIPFLDFKQYYLDKEGFPIHKTVPQWISIMKQCKKWEEDLKFNGCKWCSSYDHIPLFNRLIDYYCFGNDSYYRSRGMFLDSVFTKNYNITKFMDYMVHGTIDQAYVDVYSFMTTVRDYLKMCETHKVVPTLYSSNVKMAHDLMSRNHSVTISPEDDAKFKEKYKDFKEWEKDDYIIKAPIEALDLLREGDYLSHCVFSYVKRVIDGITLVVFLREKEHPDIPFITVEIQQGKIVQARGMHDNAISESQRQILKDYAAFAKLEVADML